MPATTVKTLIYRILWDDGDAKKKADAWNRELKESEKHASILAKAFLDIGKALGTFTIDAVKNFAQFEDTLSHARRTMRLSREETLELGDALMDLSTNFEEGGLAAGVTANELAKISGILGQLGFNARDNADQFQRLVAVVAKVGVAFGMTNQKAAEGLGILKNLYDLPVAKIENAASSIAYLGNTTVATAGQIMDIMTRMGGIAGLLGVTAQEAAALGATLRESGVRARVAGTAMAQIFSRLASDVDKFGEVLKKGGVSGGMLRMKIESGKATEALQMVLQGLQNIQAVEGKIAAAQALKDLGLSGVRVQQALLALSNNIGGLNKNLAASNRAFRENVAVNDAYQAAIDNTQKKMTQFKNLLDIIQKIIGKDLSLAFSDFLEEHLIPFTERFKEWIKESEAAEAIFGREGLIASGLDSIGVKLSESEDAFFSWLDVLDKLIPPFIEDIKEGFAEAFKDIGVDVVDAQEAFEKFKQILYDIADAIDAMKRAWKIFVAVIKAELEALENIGKLLQIDKIVYPIARMNEEAKRSTGLFGDMTEKMYETDKALDEFVNGIREAEKAGQELGDTMIYKSVLPDIAKGTIKATHKTIEYGDSLSEVTGSTKELFKTGHNAWTNLKRDVTDTMTAWELQDGYAMNRQENLQFNLYQTADAVANIGNMYNQTGEEAEEATKKMQEATEAVQTMQKTMGAAKPTGPSIKDPAAFLQWAQSRTSGQLQDLWRNPGLMTAEGIINTVKGQRVRAGQEFQAETQVRQETQTQQLNVTLQMNDQEVGRVNAILNDRNQQENRRSFSQGGTRATR